MKLPGFLVASMAFAFLGGPLPTLRAAGPRLVVVFGDSITAGNELPAAAQAQLWVRLVEAQSGGQLQMVNEGKGGRATDSVKEFEAMLKRQPHADGLIIVLGTNDSRDISAGCVPKATEHVRAMAARAREVYGPGLALWIVGPPNIRKDALGSSRPIADQRDARLRELGAAFEALAKELRCEFVSLYGVVPPESLTHDGVHPDGAGNEAIARAILPRLLGAPRP